MKYWIIDNWFKLLISLCALMVTSSFAYYFFQYVPNQKIVENRRMEKYQKDKEECVSKANTSKKIALDNFYKNVSLDYENNVSSFDFNRDKIQEYWDSEKDYCLKLFP